MKLFETDGRLVLGWREWVSLPGLGVPAIKAKVDTGARSSALHAFFVERFREAGRDRVRFGLHPLQKRTDVEIVCEADVFDERIVADSGGHREKRIIIRTPVTVGGRACDTELSLTNRDSMRFRVLLGRTALCSGMLVAPDHSYLTGRAIAKDYIKSLKKRGKK